MVCPLDLKKSKKDWRICADFIRQQSIYCGGKFKVLLAREPIRGYLLLPKAQEDWRTPTTLREFSEWQLLKSRMRRGELNIDWGIRCKDENVSAFWFFPFQLWCGLMAHIEPFPALRPRPQIAGQLCELPYDVMSSAEARQIARNKPFSFLHVSKPEIDLPDATDPYSPKVYEKGRENFSRLISDGALKQDEHPFFYFYRQIMGSHSQIGLVAAASCQDYLDGIIKKHEFTRPDKEDDRVRHIEILNSQTGPVFLAFRATQQIDAIAAAETAKDPDTDFLGSDGVRHTSWSVRDSETIKTLRDTFAAIPYLYIADGHHRSAAAARVFQSRKGAGQSGLFLTVIFPHNQLQILPYNRVLKDLNDLTPHQLLKRLEAVFEFPAGASQPTTKNQLSLYLEGQWHLLRFRADRVAGRKPLDSLDVSLLQEHVLGPIFCIDDQRTSKRINFVGGIRGASELEKLVNSKEYACAFSMYPTSMEDLMAIADANGIMPPKSTWFEPKLRDGMFCHMI